MCHLSYYPFHFSSLQRYILLKDRAKNHPWGFPQKILKRQKVHTFRGLEIRKLFTNINHVNILSAACYDLLCTDAPCRAVKSINLYRHTEIYLHDQDFFSGVNVSQLITKHFQIFSNHVLKVTAGKVTAKYYWLKKGFCMELTKIPGIV